MQKATTKKIILHLPKWYPHDADPQNGVFVQKQIQSLGSVFNNQVLFVKSARQKKTYHIEIVQQNDVQECRAYFREYQGLKVFRPIIHFHRYLSAFKKGFHQLIITSGKPDLIHAHIILRTAIMAWYYSGKSGCKYIISEHWSGFMTGSFNKKSCVYRWLAKFVFKRAEKILVVSEILKSAIIALDVPERKIEIVPNVVEISGHVEESAIKSKNDSTIILSVADLVDGIKKISEIIEVVAELSGSVSLEYWIVGDGPDRTALERLAASKGLPGSTIRFYGRKTNDEVLGIISQCDFLVMNSVIETFSVVTAEALLAGKPVVATRCGGPEVFVNESNGILIEVGVKQELKKAIGKMCETYKSYDKEALISGVKDRFNSKAVGLKLKAIYDGILIK
jgi:glycosyltransferase involved in cell wall biosynthesis